MKPDRESLISQLRAVQRMLGDVPGCENWAAMMDKIWGGEHEPPRTEDLAAAMADLHMAFDGMNSECREAVFHGWSEWRDRPGLRDVRAATQLQELRRVLAITATDRSICAEQQIVYSDGDPLVRVEIREGASRAQVIKALARTVGLLLFSWPRLIDHKQADQVKVFEPASPGDSQKNEPSRAV